MSLEVVSVTHCNVNCRDLTRSLEFYQGLLGLQPIVHTNPDPQEAPSFGLHGPIQWDAYLMGGPTGTAGPVVDLLEWKLPPPVGEPYVAANHLGLACLSFAVPDVPGLHSRLQAKGVRCLAAPRRYPIDIDGEPAAFVCADPDGTSLRLEEGDAAGPRFVRATINCANLERSTEWYRRVLGFRITERTSIGPVAGVPVGLTGDVAWEACTLAPTTDDGFAIELVEWKTPEPVGRPYEAANHLGIYRMALIVADAKASNDELTRLGVDCPPPVLLDIMPGVQVWAVFFPDPDGTTLELIEAPQPPSAAPSLPSSS